MTELHLPFLELAVATPLLGAGAVALARDSRRAFRWSVALSALALFAAVGAWQSFSILHARGSHPPTAHDRWDLLAFLANHEVLVVDELSAPKLPLIALLFFLTILTTQRTKTPPFSFALSLGYEALTLAAFACRDPWAVIVLLSLCTVPPFLEFRRRNSPTRVYVLHSALFVVCMVAGWALVNLDGPREHSLLVLVPLLLAVFVRSGMVPFHCWVPDLFEHSSFGTALLTLAPMTGAYAAVRLLVPIAPDWVLHGIGLVAVVTAVYASGMALVQREARRFFCYLFLSHSALVLLGLEIVTPIGLTGALCVWLSAALALGGLGLTLRALEARFGRLSLDDFRGLYEHVPALAICFAVAGLAGVGFPGTAGFVGIEMLIDGAVTTYPHVGVSVLLATALNGIAVMRAYFLIFTGSRHSSTVPLRAGFRERIAVIVFAVLLLGAGFFPQPGVATRFEAAQRLLRDRVSSAEPDRRTPSAGSSANGSHSPEITERRDSSTNARQ